MTNGVYVYDASKDIVNSKTTIKSSCHYSFISTVKENENKFIPREINGAQTAIELYHKVGRPSHQTYIQMLENNFIRDCPVTTLDVKRALSIYGRDVCDING